LLCLLPCFSSVNCLSCFVTFGWFSLLSLLLYVSLCYLSAYRCFVGLPIALLLVRQLSLFLTFGWVSLLLTPSLYFSLLFVSFYMFRCFAGCLASRLSSVCPCSRHLAEWLYLSLLLFAVCLFTYVSLLCPLPCFSLTLLGPWFYAEEARGQIPRELPVRSTPFIRYKLHITTNKQKQHTRTFYPIY
jgi:hypothetical protein